MKFLDSNVLAYAFYNNKHSESCQRAIEIGGMIDTFNLAEAFHILENETSREEAQSCIKGLFKANISIVDVDLNIIFEAIKNMNRHTLSVFDSIHYTCALLNNCDSIISFDRDFDGLELTREEP